MGLRDAITKNWKTSAIGVTLAFSGYVAMFPAGFPELAVNLSRFIQVGGMSALGIVAKDGDRIDSE